MPLSFATALLVYHNYELKSTGFELVFLGFFEDSISGHPSEKSNENFVEF